MGEKKERKEKKKREKKKSEEVGLTWRKWIDKVSGDRWG